MAGKHKAEDSATRPHRRNSADENQSSARQCSLEEEARDWDIQQVANFLEQEKLEEFVPIFKAEKITGAVLCDITDDTLEKMGIKAAGDKLKILQTLKPFGHVRERNDWKVFNDPIHGHIELHPLCVKIVDTPQFQRLRYIKQLGGCYFVFPGASHNRFEHCIGVCYLAGQLVKTLKEKQPELDITEIDMLCVQIAGLCHDLGHGPFSHLFDGKFIPKVRPDRNWKHEDASVDMFDYMVENCDLIPEFEKYGLTEKDRTFIKEQIAGPLKENKGQCGRDVKKKFLYEIVANKRTGIDVDKWDYFDRDCHMLGIKNNFDHVRFMKLARVCDVEGVTQICPRDKEVDNLYDMFHTRMALHRRAYQHKNSYIVETMIVEAMVKADDHIKIPGRDGKPMKISETIDDMAAFCKLTDHIFHLILLSTEPELNEARKILENIQQRKLYKCVGETICNPESGEKLLQGSESEIKERISQAMTDEELGKPQLKPDDFVIHIINLDYGMKDKNPIDHVRFYEKSNPSLAKLIRKDEVSQMLPVVFAEQHIRCYCKKLDEDSISIATRCFERWREQITMPKYKGPDGGSTSPTQTQMPQHFVRHRNRHQQEVDTSPPPRSQNQQGPRYRNRSRSPLYPARAQSCSLPAKADQQEPDSN